MSHTVLVVDDEPRMRQVLATALKELGYEALTAADGAAALEQVEADTVDLVLSDLRMPGMSGHELLLELRRRAPDVPVVLMTAYSTVKDAVQAIKDGAFDYIGKPFEMDELETTIAKALRLSATLRDNQRLREELEGRYRFENLVGSSAVFRKVIEAIAEVCESRTNVLIHGESGTGKEMVARAIHFNSARHEGPFVAINCAAIPESLLESELFGHVKGAFTGAVSARQGRFAQADGGTLFLDEVGDMPMALQAKILRVLQERSFEPLGSSHSRSTDVRILAATNRDLREAVRDGRFRSDLYYRLNVFPIEVPPLRARREDIPQLVSHLACDLARHMGRPAPAFSEAALRTMQDYAWPGNVRELQNCIERAIIVAKGGSVDVAELPQDLLNRAVARETVRIPSDLDGEMQKLEREFILEALRSTGGVQVQAAELLGISERSLWHRVKKLGISIVKKPG
jgi:two-component system, NtrC family, response regulator AtoC